MKGQKIIGERSWILWVRPPEGGDEYRHYIKFDVACEDIMELLVNNQSVDGIELYWINGEGLRVLGGDIGEPPEPVEVHRIACLVPWKHIVASIANLTHNQPQEAVPDERP